MLDLWPSLGAIVESRNSRLVAFEPRHVCLAMYINDGLDLWVEEAKLSTSHHLLPAILLRTQHAVLQAQDHCWRRWNHKCCQPHSSAVFLAKLFGYVLNEPTLRSTQGPVLGSWRCSIPTHGVRWWLPSHYSLLPLGFRLWSARCPKQPFSIELEHHSVSSIGTAGCIFWCLFPMPAHHIRTDPSTFRFPVSVTCK